MTLRVCAEPGCPEVTSGPRCVRHERPSSSARNHGGVSPSRRGHGRAFRRARAELIGRPCELRLAGCTGVAESADYVVPCSQGGGSGALRPACLHCQRAQGAALARASR